MRILIVIPAYNEAENIERVVDDLVHNFKEYDYVVVNDGSSDDTAKICKEKGYNLLDLPVNLGLAGGFQAGIQYGYMNQYDAVLQYDGDGQHQAKYIKKMADLMEETNSDIVIGSRFVTKKKPRGMRMIGSRIISWAIKVTTGEVITDPTSGMRLIHRRILREFAYMMNYGPEPDTVSYLIRSGVKVKETQVEMSERIAGESYLNVKKAMFYMIRMCASIILIQRFRKRGV